MKSKSEVASNNEITIVDVYKEITKTVGREAAIQKIEQASGIMFPNADWSGYTNSNFISNISRKSIVCLSTQFFSALSLDFRLVPFDRFTAAALLEKQCEDLKLDMLQLTHVNILDPPDIEYVLFLCVMISAATGRKTDLLDEIIGKVSGLRMATQAISTILSTQLSRVENNVLLSFDEAHSNTHKNTGGLKLSEEGEQAILVAQQRFNFFKNQEHIKKTDKETEELLSDIYLNPRLMNKIKYMRMDGRLDDAKNRVMLKNQDDVLLLKKSDNPQFLGKDRHQTFINYCNKMTMKVFLIKILKLNFSSVLFNKMLRRLLRDVDIHILNNTSAELITSAIKLNVTVTPAKVEEVIKNEEKIDLNNELMMQNDFSDLVTGLKSLTLTNIPEFNAHIDDVPEMVYRNGILVTSEEAYQIDQQMSMKLIGEVLNLRKATQVQTAQNLRTLLEEAIKNIQPVNNNPNVQQQAQQNPFYQANTPTNNNTGNPLTNVTGVNSLETKENR